MRRLRLLTDLWTLRQSMAFQSVLGHPSVRFARLTVSWPAPNFHLEVSFPYRTLRTTHLLIASAPFQVGPLGEPYPAGYGFPLSFGRSGIRFSILPSPAGDLDLPRGRLAVGHTPADPIGVSTFRMRKRGVCAVGAGAFFTPRSTVFLSRSRSQTPVRVRPLIIGSTRVFR
jgi:hypothetical protein